MAPVLNALNKTPGIQSVVCASGQQHEMFDQVLKFFGLNIDHWLNIKRRSFGINELLAGIVDTLDPVLEDEQPDYVLVHGDTSTTAASALAAFNRRIAVGHVEAGLRTGDLQSPWPEEGNRKLVAAVASLHFAPTQAAAGNLYRENIPRDRVMVTGNTVIDALMDARQRLSDGLSAGTLELSLPRAILGAKRFLLVTAHRRESFGRGIRQICQAVRQIAEAHPEVAVVYPVHPNPNIREPVYSVLSGINNVYLLEPQEYPEFVYLMMYSDFILTDSGGVQEEAPSLQKPVLVLRNVTERPEALDSGILRLVGTDCDLIVKEALALLNGTAKGWPQEPVRNPYGDGLAAARIVHKLNEA